MPSPSTTKLPVPKSWDEFEDIVSDVLRARWATPHVARYGRSGQQQHGVDIYAMAAHLDRRYAGAQCKLVESLSVSELEAIVREADRFQPPLAEFLITTSLPRDAKLQARVRNINVARISAGKFPVEVLFWEDISLDLSGDKRLLAKHFPDWSRLTAKDEEPEFKIGWVVDEHVSDEATVTALAPDTTDILGGLDPYLDEEVEYLRRVNPRDADKAEEFNRTVQALAADPTFQKRWRANDAGIAMIDGTRVGIAVSLEKAPASDVLVHLDFDADIDVFRADARPAHEKAFVLPEHPALESERRYATNSLFDPSWSQSASASILGIHDLWRPSLRVQRPYSIYAEDSRVTIRIKRLAPRRSFRFDDEEDGIVISPWCGAGIRAVRWHADAENLVGPQSGELRLLIQANTRPLIRRRQSYIGEPLHLISKTVGNEGQVGDESDA